MFKKSVGSILALALIVATSAFAADDLFDTATASKHIDQGLALLKAKKFDRAINEFEEAATINPDAEAYYYLGYAYYLKGRSGDEASRKKSRENFAKAYEIDPNFSPTRLKPTEPAPQGEMSRPSTSGAEQPSAQTPTTAPSSTI